MEEGEGGNAGLEKREGKGRRRRGIGKRVVGGAQRWMEEGGRRCRGV